MLLAHGPDADTPLHEMAWAFENLREAGKIRWWGAVNFDQDAIAGLALYPGFVAYQGKLNLLDRGALDDVLPACHAAGVGFMAYSPLAMGLLTGKYRQRAVFGGGDFRSHSSHFTEEGFAAAQHGIATLRRSAWAHGVSMTQMAMAWTLHMGAGHTIVGFKTEEQMRENVGAGEVLLTEHDVRRLLEAFRVDSESVDEDEETLWLT